MKWKCCTPAWVASASIAADNVVARTDGTEGGGAEHERVRVGATVEQLPRASSEEGIGSGLAEDRADYLTAADAVVGVAA